jgi:hypothetical protein
MRTSTLILSIATATFATTTGWLAWELHQRDAKTLVAIAARDVREADRDVANAAAPGTANASSSLSGAASPATGSAALAAHGVTVGAEHGDAKSSLPGKRNLDQDPSVGFARQFLARYDDSAQRQAQLDEARSAVRRQYEPLKEKLGLGKDKFEQLVSLVAEQNLDAQAHWARCAVDPNCEPNNPRPGTMDDRSQEYLALLGADRVDDFNRFRDALMERDSVAHFRGRLSDAQFLPQSQAEQLIAALANERQLYSQESDQRGVQLRALGTPLGTIWYPADAGSIDEQLAGAALYSQRVRDRAAAVLSPAQHAAFVQMQDELLAQLASFIRPPPPAKPDKADKPTTLTAAQR